MIDKLDHIAIAVSDLNESIAVWEKTLGAHCVHREIVAEQKTEVAVLELGSLRIELISPSTPDSPVAKALEKRGPGLHHIALCVNSAAEALAQLKQNGGKLIDESPRPGAQNSRVAFVHPKTLGGVLVELVEHQKNQ